jgi:hypothetical protein
MAVAPLIKPIQTQKGMFYTFQSSLEDLSLTFNNNTNKFRFSKFALLRIPEIGIPTTMATDNRTQFLAVGETPITTGLSANQNINLAKSFQNYALNLETLLISQEAYAREQKLNVSERVFWKWLKETGAIRWRAANNTEVISTLPVNQSRWAEDWGDASSTSYNRVVQYIADIDVINSVRSKENSYSELYIHVPTNVGTSPTVLFNSIADVNYHPGMLVVNSPGDPLDVEYLAGRHYTDSHPYTGMDLLAYYDLDSDSATQKMSDVTNTVINWTSITSPYNAVSNPTGVGFWWGANQLVNSYHTDQAAYYGARTGTNSSASSAIKTQKIYKKNASPVRSVEYLRSTLDGAVIDFDLANYKVAQQNSNINSLAQLNDSVGNYDFEFNAILVYYDVFDPANPTDTATNLYGVYFLNKVEQSGIDFIIPMITKEKPDPINKTNGNAFAFKVNLKFDTSIEDVAVEKSINDYTTVGLDLFLDVLTEFRKLQTKFNDKLAELEALKIDVDAAKQALTNTTGIAALATRISQVETTVAASTEAFDNAAAIMDLIDSLNSRLDDLHNNQTSLQLSYNLAPFKKGYGIVLDKTVPGQMTIASDVQAYSNMSQVDLSSTLINILNVTTLTLGTSNTYYKHYKPISQNNLNPASWTLTSDQTIKLDDSVYNWRKGQTVRLVIDTQIVPNNYTIYIKTDAANASNQVAEYSVIIDTLTQADFPVNYGRTGRPIIEITCIDPVNFVFQVDKIIR